MYDRLQIVAFPKSYGKNVFAFSYKADYKENGWDVYDAEKELRRLVRRERERGGERRGGEGRGKERGRGRREDRGK